LQQYKISVQQEISKLWIRASLFTHYGGQIVTHTKKS